LCADFWVRTLAQDKEIKRVPVTRTSNSGKEMFGAYCAPCHGLDGTGNGPAATALKKMPADLTQLAAKSGGKYPSAHVFATLKQVDSPVHGSKEMPVWGTLLSSVSSSEAETQLRMNNLVSYVQSLQKR
jgi:mono/diheme cytochrome c family protein